MTGLRRRWSNATTTATTPVALTARKKVWTTQSAVDVRLRPGKTAISKALITPTMIGPARRVRLVSQKPRKKSAEKVSDEIAPSR
jgi:hypothetical protein